MYPNLSLYINGQFVEGRGESSQEVRNPSNNEVLGTLPKANEEDLELALQAAERAFQSWKLEPAIGRSEILRKVANLIRERAEQTGRILTLEQGKPIREAFGEVMSCAEHAEWHAEECRRIYGRVIPSRNPDVQQIALKEPIGVCVAFSPWNFPFSQAFRKVVAAIGAGCTIILKGSSDTPASVLLMAQMFHDAGLPKGVFNVVSGDSAMISDYLIKSPVVRKISFTGSTPVGRGLASLAGAYMKGCTMELGGHAPVIICDDADIDKAVSDLVGFKFRNAGQICICPTRFFVQRTIYAEFVARFSDKAKEIKVGCGSEELTMMGPLAQSRRVQEMASFVDDACQKGGTLVTGGFAMPGDGNFYPPTVIKDVPEDARFMHEEPFGPIAGFMAFDEIPEVLERANRLPFGLAAYAYTSSVSRAHSITNGLEAGMVSVNHIGLALAETPFGGIKESGYGREGGSETFDGYLVTKFVTQMN
ncbi:MULTISPECIES: NAD-dependent succinate-semialdehyde dehydrogenase [Marinobacter]|uniref:NAD-dependent succinate-semialdehyde dehydrogenase n=1 Tax=Marinobacter profundi TaxID=2666256 RepID=A0A2G1URT7_9GAMM|nr:MULTISPECIES: NAD-dependent succinate-semialdehyde dehydrogenase [Marinobacter]MBD3656676.1 NAD-dependent succinate-semialdehyde dehydrogenase [Marinobacter sp.]PHQ17099.1 NAD-dependent succinate-semialdehyde dehydrogenase [Marinobacter profundi]